MLWLTNLTESNDREEVERTFCILWNNIKDKLRGGSYSTGLRELIEEQIRITDENFLLQRMTDIPFGCCFSLEGDLIQQWNEYGANGDGVSIEFDLSILKIKQKMPITSKDVNRAIGYEKVIYDYKEVADKFAYSIEDIINKEKHHAWIAILITFKHYAGFIKNPVFKDEKETRIVYFPEDDHDGQEIGLSKIIREPCDHYCLCWNDGTFNAMKSIIVGNNCSMTSGEIRDFLEKNNIDSTIPIYKSQSSYRKR